MFYRVAYLPLSTVWNGTGIEINSLSNSDFYLAQILLQNVV